MSDTVKRPWYAYFHLETLRKLRDAEKNKVKRAHLEGQIEVMEAFEADQRSTSAKP